MELNQIPQYVQLQLQDFFAHLADDSVPIACCAKPKQTKEPRNHVATAYGSSTPKRHH